ncbi:MAG TPA: hypothetical protein VD902_19390 [Symbiobacteriaceae bacterium]|nr:hypothetical protein [Symbiobacteriaceae bacterium]
MPDHKQPSSQQTRQLDHQAASQVPGRSVTGKSYLDHGVESSVAMDNPDDSQLGAEKGQDQG